MNTTLCWKCSAEYALTAEKCPKCGATNANHDLDLAMAEQAELENLK